MRMLPCIAYTYAICDMQSDLICVRVFKKLLGSVREIVSFGNVLEDI